MDSQTPRTEYKIAMKLLSVSTNPNLEIDRFFLTPTERHELAKLCIDIRSLFDWDFNFQEFYEIIVNYHYFSLEFYWILHVCQVMPFEVYILSCTQNDILGKFTESFLKLCMEEFDGCDEQFLFQTGTLSYFVSKAFPVMEVTCDEKMKQICLGIIRSLLRDIFSIEEDEIKTKRLSCFFALWVAGTLEEKSLSYFCSFALDFYLDFYPTANVLDAFEMLENSRTNTFSYHLSTVTEKLVKTQKSDGIIHFLKCAAVQKTEINANALLVIVKAFFETHQDVSASLSKLVSELMNEAYDKSRYEILLRALLIGYQASYWSNASSHIHYRLWFQIAIDSNFCIPSEFQSMYDDYIILLKTRFQDLKPSTKQELTVEKALSLFESLGKIPPVVMEISLLQKHFFVNEFLPALLIPRVVPPVPDIRERFINALYKAGKIPSGILQKYKDGCLEKQNKIIEDINMIDNDFDEDDYM